MSWEALLQAEPAAPFFSASDALVHLMDSTLAQVWDVLRSRSLAHWLGHSSSAGQPLWNTAGCSLNPLPPYFRTGERSLRLLARLVEDLLPELTVAEHAAQREELLAAFHSVAQGEVNLFCATCRRHPDCPSGKTPPSLERAGQEAELASLN
ncbi:MAG: hypothetical protein ABSE59_10215 [Opitutaceae bacterium]|jgi:hypothetical protein